MQTPQSNLNFRYKTNGKKFYHKHITRLHGIYLKFKQGSCLPRSTNTCASGFGFCFLGWFGAVVVLFRSLGFLVVLVSCATRGWNQGSAGNLRFPGLISLGFQETQVQAWHISKWGQWKARHLTTSKACFLNYHVVYFQRLAVPINLKKYIPYQTRGTFCVSFYLHLDPQNPKIAKRSLRRNSSFLIPTNPILQHSRRNSRLTS